MCYKKPQDTHVTIMDLFALIHLAPNLKISRDDYITYGKYVSRRAASIMYNINKQRRRKRQTSIIKHPGQVPVSASVGLFMDGEKIGVTKNPEDEAIVLEVD